MKSPCVGGAFPIMAVCFPAAPKNLTGKHLTHKNPDRRRGLLQRHSHSPTEDKNFKCDFPEKLRQHMGKSGLLDCFGKQMAGLRLKKVSKVDVGSKTKKKKRGRCPNLD